MGVCIKCFTINVLLRTLENDERTKIMRPKILPLVHLNFSAPLIFIHQMDKVYPNTLSGTQGGGGGRGRDRTASNLEKKLDFYPNIVIKIFILLS